MYADKAAADYDRKLALYPPDVLAWVQETQPEAWEQLQKNHGEAAGQKLLERLRDAMDKQSTLAVLRQGFDVLGLKRKVHVAQFKPALGLNPEITKKYEANRLRVVRQVKYSLHNENSIDMVLFLNGLPMATVELKTDFTQSVEDAVDQYRYDRLPQQKGKAPEPLLSFPGGALVHFAVSTKRAMMATKLAGPKTYLPAVRPGRSWGVRQPGRRQGASDPVSMGRSLGARELAGHTSAGTSNRLRTDKKKNLTDDRSSIRYRPTSMRRVRLFEEDG